jgi:hypothetical protein
MKTVGNSYFSQFLRVFFPLFPHPPQGTGGDDDTKKESVGIKLAGISSVFPTILWEELIKIGPKDDTAKQDSGKWNCWDSLWHKLTSEKDF